MKEARTINKAWMQYTDYASDKSEFQKAIIWIFALVAAALVWIARKI